jgi:hypothetical protein
MTEYYEVKAGRQAGRKNRRSGREGRKAWRKD